MDRVRSLSRLAGVLLLAWPSVASSEARDAGDLVSELSRIGSRIPGTDGHLAGQALLLDAMKSAGLQDVRRMPPIGSGGWSHLTGTIPGSSVTEFVLTAHYDTVDGSRGELDNAAGCAATLAAIAGFSRVPLRNTMRVMLTDGEEDNAGGSRAWLSSIPSEERQRMLANLNVDMVGSRLHPGPGVVHILAGWSGDRRLVTPAWLVHAVLRGAETSGLPVAVLDRKWSWLAQLAVRCALPARLSDGRRFLEAGVPAVTVSDLSLTKPRGHHSDLDGDVDTVDEKRLHSWDQMISATSRRLDTLEDRPGWETEYLVLMGRVWIRRDLVWAGFCLWILLVWRGLPGSWRRQAPEDRRRRGRSYLPGFAYRMMFLVTVFWIPTFATLLLYPVGALALIGPVKSPSSQRLLCWLAALPTLVFSIWLTVGQLAGWFVFDRAALPPAILVLLTLASFCAWQRDQRPCQLAGRFSRKAATPSSLSAEAKQRQNRSRS